MLPHLTFSGCLGSGKSAIADALAQRLGIKRVGFGSTIAAIARERGVEQQRENLQRLGAELVVSDPNTLCRRVLRSAGDYGEQSLIIDGIRHRAIFDTLSSLLTPRPLKAVFVDAPMAIRYGRLRIRDGVTDAEIANHERHSTEQEALSNIRAWADVVVDNSTSLEAAVLGLQTWLATF